MVASRGLLPLLLTVVALMGSPLEDRFALSVKGDERVGRRARHAHGFHDCCRRRWRRCEVGRIGREVAMKA